MRATLAKVESAGIDHIGFGDHLSFHVGFGYDGLSRAAMVLGAS